MELGDLLIYATVAFTALGMAAYAPGLRGGDARPRLGAARIFVYLSAVGLVATIALLWSYILDHRFEYSYVFRYSSLDMPFRYVVASMWGGQEGTFLLWAVFGGLLAILLRFKARHYEAPVNFFYMGITLFLLLMLVKRSPFETFDTIPPDGNGLNPLLQDPWMTIHPPIMFLGFASLGIPAAFAMAALVRQDWDSWIPRSLPWTLVGVVSLGTGLTLGGYWSYSILGWGGYWGWDPVENSSLVPWLFSVTLLHTQVIQLKRGLFRRANLLLALLPFLFLTYSTFLTRSGVLADFSVHSFTDLGINGFLVAFMAIFMLGGVGLFAWRFRRIPSDTAHAPFMSREYFMFLGALSFGLFAVFVCLGTSAPIISKLWGQPANVEPEFYNRIGLPFTILISILLGFAPHLLWNRELGTAKLLKRTLIPLGLAALMIPVFVFAMDIRYWPYVVMMTAGSFALFSNALVAGEIVRRKWTAAGGYITHVGLGFMVLGILTSTTLDSTRLLQLPRDHEVPWNGYSFRYIGHRPVEDGRKDAYDVVVSRGEKSWLMSPTMYYSTFNGGMMKKPAIQALWNRDIYIAPGGHLVEGVDERVKSFLTLHKRQPQQFGDLTLTFDRFETSGMENGVPTGEETTITAHIEVAHGDDEPYLIYPTVQTGPEGMTGSVPADLPGTGYMATLDGIDATAGRVRVGISDPPLTLAMGETGLRKGYRIRFDRFDVDMGDGRGTKITVYTECTVFMGPDSVRVKPGYVHLANMDPELIEAPLGDTGLNLVLAEVNAAERTADFHVAREPIDALWVEASLKPFIVLLWIGTALVVLGLLVAVAYRGSLATRMAKRLGDGMGVVSSKREAA